MEQMYTGTNKNPEELLSEVFGNDFNSLTRDEKDALRQDVWEIVKEIPNIDYYQASVVLRQRIGGSSQLFSYVQCLMKGKSKHNNNLSSRILIL